MDTIYKLPEWAETLLVICVAIMLAGLAAWLACNAIKTAIEAESKLEHKRRHSETKALNKWQKLYEEEHQLRADDNAALIAKVIDLESENKRIKQLLAKVKVKDL